MSALTPLAHILNKAQGVIDAETGLPIDVGGEVAAIRDELRNQRAEIERLHAKLQRLQSTNHHIANMLSNAERAGGEMDRPEGARYITLSDTLARQIAKELTAEDEEQR